MADQRWENRVQETARALSYPETPNVVEAVRLRQVTVERPVRSRPLPRWAMGAGLALLLVVIGLGFVPQVRASVLALLRVGGIRVLLAEPTPTAPPSSPADAAPGSGMDFPSTATPQPAPVMGSVLELVGETTLVEAAAEVSFPIRVPTYPPDLGPPERVYLQALNGPVVVLVWLDSAQPERVRLSLHQLGPGVLGEKAVPVVVRETTVNGSPALWTEGPYLLQYLTEQGDPIYDSRRLVNGRVLVWQADEITYRLESDFSLEDAVQIAESLE